MSQLAKQTVVGTVITVTHRDSIVYQRAAGFADREAPVWPARQEIFSYSWKHYARGFTSPST